MANSVVIRSRVVNVFASTIVNWNCAPGVSASGGAVGERGRLAIAPMLVL